jgi:hypothetical protein
MTETVQQRLASAGFPEVRFNDGVVIQHLLAEELGTARVAETRAALTANLSRLDADQAIRNRRVRPPT